MARAHTAIRTSHSTTTLAVGVQSCPGAVEAIASELLPRGGGAESSVDDLGLSRGVVLSRAAASLRSVETKPYDWQICPLWTGTSAACIFLY